MCACAHVNVQRISHTHDSMRHTLSGVNHYEIMKSTIATFFFVVFFFRLVFDDQFFLPAQNNKHDLNIELMGIGSVYLVTRLSVRLRS